MLAKKYATEEERKQARKESAKKYRENNKHKKNAYYVNNKEKILARAQRYRDNNKDSLKVYFKKRYSENKNLILSKMKTSRQSRREIIIQRRKKSYSINKGLILAKQKEWREKNKDKIKEQKIKSYHRNKKPLSLTQKLNKRKWQLMNKDKAILATNKYAKKNPAYRRSISMMRRQRKNNVFESFSRILVIQTYSKFNYKCFNCSTTENLTIDHHYPLSKGFALTINNAVLLCRSCNSSKHNKLPESFYSPEQLSDLQLNYGISKSPIEEKQQSLFEARMPKNLERDNGILEAMNAA